MDVTYRDSIVEQVRGNVHLDIDIKRELLDIFKKVPDNDIEYMVLAAGLGDRGMYQLKNDDLKNDAYFNSALKHVIEKNHIYSQAKANREMRETGEISNQLFRTLYETDYVKAGHKYVRGIRIY